MPNFLSGLDLSRHLFDDAVGPLLAAHCHHLVYSAALIGPGSEVLGFDTTRSMDHQWGPRLQLFLSDGDVAEHGERIDTLLARELPHELLGISTHFGPPDAVGVRLRVPAQCGPVQHMVSVHSLDRFWREHTGTDATGRPRLQDWLAVPQQTLLTLTAGAVFHDGLDRLNTLRERWRWYPDDLWRYLMAAQWTRVSQEEAFMGRCGEVGDELGSMVVAGRLVRDLMRLCFLIERQYAPYSKWLGSAFARLRCGPRLVPVLTRVMQSPDWPTRERHLADAYGIVAALHNQLGLTPPLPTTVSAFHDRPYQVIHGDRFAAALRATVRDPAVQALAPGVGAIDQFVDSTDVLRPGPARHGGLLSVHGRKP